MVKKNQIIILIIILAGCLGYFFFKNREKYSMSPDCVFCKIIARQLPATIVAENDAIIVIKDLYPKAATHLLIIPKKHIQDIQGMHPEDLPLAQSMMAMAQELAKPNKQDFKLVINSGKNAGQKVFHLHMHYLAGEGLRTDFL